MDRRAKVELFERIRREYEFGIGSVRGVARELGVHRRLVRQALASALPEERTYAARACPVLGPLKSGIEAILESDKRAPRKQRHTAHRIWVRLCQEHPECPVAESTVRAFVRERKQALGLAGRQVWVAQVYGWGEEAQVDWYEAYADLGDERTRERTKVQVFGLRSMKSGAAFHRAYLAATQQAFFEAHEEAFAYFGGVFRLLRYDNLSSAVKKILRGHTREEHTRFIAFRSHWGFVAEFCSASQPQEKGGIEGEVGRFRRNHFVPVPAVADLAGLNAHLLASCREDESRLIGDRRQKSGELLLAERSHLLALPAESFDVSEAHTGLVDGKGCVRAHTNCYSTPLAAGTKAEVRVWPSVVTVRHAGREVARHPRSYGRGEQVLNLEHYLDVLDRKPGALAGAQALAQWRQRGLWPESLDRLWAVWQERLGKQAGTRAMVDLLLFARSAQHGWPALKVAAEQAMALGCTDESAVQCLLAQGASGASSTSGGSACRAGKLSAEELGDLSRYDRPLPVMSGYDQLLAGVQ